MGRVPRSRSRTRVGESRSTMLRTHHTARSLPYSWVECFTEDGSREWAISELASSASRRTMASGWPSSRRLETI